MILSVAKHYTVFCDGCTREIARGKTPDQAWENAVPLGGNAGSERTNYFLCLDCLKDPEGAKAQQAARARVGIGRLWPK